MRTAQTYYPMCRYLYVSLWCQVCNGWVGYWQVAGTSHPYWIYTAEQVSHTSGFCVGSHLIFPHMGLSGPSRPFNVRSFRWGCWSVYIKEVWERRRVKPAGGLRPWNLLCGWLSGYCCSTEFSSSFEFFHVQPRNTDYICSIFLYLRSDRPFKLL